jgi:hypothetical protein
MTVWHRRRIAPPTVPNAGKPLPPPPVGTSAQQRGQGQVLDYLMGP